MSRRLWLALVASTAIGCGAEGHAAITITDLVVTPTAAGTVLGGTFNLHVARPEDATGSSRIRLHTLEIKREDSGSSGLPFVVARLLGEAPSDVEPGAEAVFPMGFELDRAGSLDEPPFQNCSSSPDGFFLDGIYFDDAEGAFFPIRSTSSWLPSTSPSGATWAESFGDATPQLAHDVAVFPDGSSIIVGSTAGAADFKETTSGAQPIPAPFVMKLDAAGKLAWSRLTPIHAVDPLMATDQGPRLVAAAPDGSIVVAGTFDGKLDLGTGEITSAGATDVFLARLDANGKAMETRQFGDGLTQTVTTMDVDAAGNAVLVGALSGAMDFGAGPVSPLIDPASTSFYVAKLPPTGAPVYAKVPLVISRPDRFAAAVGLDGAVILGGSFLGSAWIGAEPPQEVGEQEAGFLVKLAADGAVAWSTVVGGALVTQVALDQGDVVATVNIGTGATLGGQPVSGGMFGALVLARFDPAGALRYAVPIGGSGVLEVASLVIDSAGHALLAGHLVAPLSIPGPLSDPAVAQSAFLVEFDRNGALVRSTGFGCTNSPVDVAVARTGPRDLVLVSTFYGAVDFGKGIVPAAGATDLLVAKLPAQ